MDKERLRREEKIKYLLSIKYGSERQVDNIYDGQLIRRLGAYISGYKEKMLLAIILIITASLFSVAQPWIVGQAVDKGITANNLEQLRLWSILFIIVACLDWLANRIRIFIVAYLGTHVVADIRSDLFRHLQRLSLNFYHNYSVGQLMSRLISDVGVLVELITWSITGASRALFVLFSIIIILLILNWQLALVTFAVFPLMLILTNYWRTRVRKAYRATRRRLSLINGYLNESISGIRVIKSFTREAFNHQHFDDLNHAYFDSNVDAARLTALFFPGVDFMGALATALVVGVGGWAVLQDALTAGTLVAFILYVQRFFEPIRELAQRYNTFQSSMAASERIFGLLDTEPTVLDASDAYELPPIQGKIQFKDVSFNYIKGERVLHDINLDVAVGQRIALVGETGAGKSTMIRLLARFFDVDKGAIFIDGHNIRHVTQHSLRSQLGIVLQDTFLFGGTIADNIRYGHLDASEEAIINAAKAVGAHQFITLLPEGYATLVGEDGVNLSVGQRQIIAFARALLANPRILILDEATSSVDTSTEKQIEYAVEQLMAGRTSFVIAHRLNTVVNADKIVVLDQGHIVEMGTHQELLAQQGRYYNLYTMQWA